MPTQTVSVAVDGNDEGGWFTDTQLYIDSGIFVGLSFLLSSAIPSGSTINEAFIRGFSTFSDGAASIDIEVEDADPGANTAFGSGHLPSTATVYTAVSVGSFSYSNSTWYWGNGDAAETDIAVPMQAAVDDYGGIGSSERVNVVLSATAGLLFIEALSAAGTNEAEIYIDWTEGGGAAVGPLVWNHRRLLGMS